MDNRKISKELLAIAGKLIEPDPFENENMNGLHKSLSRWINKKLNEVPQGSPIQKQIQRSSLEVSEEIKLHMNLEGREAVDKFLSIVSGHFNLGATPLRSLWKKYGDEIEPLFWKYRIS